MTKIKVKKPSEEKLKELGTDKWSLWECEPSTFEWSYNSNEDCYILEGRAKVKTVSEEVEFGKGDLVQFPKGLSCTWTVIERIKKVYNLY
ncbi:MAG: cupin domain-containing protein [bacterium]